ncbi:oxidoreductase, acyl CoA dehydrogenase family (plasmid) [Legionella adelaidensis]|uniref:Acyl-coenzyme A dehydrogenase n=1 Tax=Legionella adelaidensis TaxID=45056 RepID=A0A0W0R4M3_9GAMM|nr:acyl-CoA dehydrogenase [Legionella adelaidensis]VEH86310.1 oxidoreductase, acyl CoA dehydrogenase family [Legionella adelaidensis]
MLILLFVLIAAVVLLMAKQAAISVWGITYLVLAALFIQLAPVSVMSYFFIGLLGVFFIVGTIKPLRRALISNHLFHVVEKALPKMSKTEREALEAGSIGWEADIFSGSPDYTKLLNTPIPPLTTEEQAFLDGPVNALCRMVDDWEVTHNLTDLPSDVWQFIKDNKFLGMIIPKQFGGLEFSAQAVMSVLSKLYGRSISLATTVAVPNSLGPGELLLKYGTEEQKNYYLPRLANGTEIPCFALTGPNAGSDAASIPDKGEVCKQTINGKEVLGIRVSWDKRFITLCPVATLVGLAFRLFDPDNLLGKGYDVGISCALIPADTPGVIKGRRHFPLNIAFLNGPTQGKDVFIPLDYLIGGVEMAGQGWRMLMECLSAGRAISLPSSALGGSQAAALASGAYARVRKQFSLPIGKFEGIEEPLARIAGNTYLIDASLTMTAAAIDRGEKSAVAGAILKYHTTELARQVALDAMDIHGGKGICLGPNNYLGRGYQATPISITVEGANILTRSLIIFGQGAIRCHPYVLKEIESIRSKDRKAFDNAFWGHIAFFFSNFINSVITLFTDGHFLKSPPGATHRYFQLLTRYSRNLAFLADFSMFILGANLKRKEKLSARLGDILSKLYLISGVLKRFQQDGQPSEDLPLVNWCCQQLFYETEVAMRGVVDNFPGKGARVFLRLVLTPWTRRQKPSDSLGQKVAQLLLQPGETRSRISRLTFAEALESCPLGRLEETFYKVCAAEVTENKVIKAFKEGKLQSLTFLEQIEEAFSLQLINETERLQLKDMEVARQQAIAVDDFANEELARTINHTGEEITTKKKLKVKVAV